MYSFEWDKSTRGYRLTTQTGRFVANEMRPVFAEELVLTGLASRFQYDKNETQPLMWAQKNVYLVVDKDEKEKPYGRKVAQLNGTQYGKPLSPEFFFDEKLKLKPVDTAAMVVANAPTMDIIVADAKRRIKELYDADIKSCDIAYIAFSGGKDSVALLDLCHRVLPLSVPVIFSDTDMELPDTYKIWEEVQSLYPDREFIKAAAEMPALESWRTFAPPSRTIRWCCSVHKSTPALVFLKHKLRKSAIKVMAFVGVRGDESYSRSFYEDASDGVKNASQLNRMPIIDWSAHELWLYIFANTLLINPAYKKGLSRVGCLLCPESSEKYEWFVDKAYPRLLKPYNDIIITTSAKHFDSATEQKEFIGKRYWQARKSGVVLHDTITPLLEQNNGLCVSFHSHHFTKELFFEWVKTIGTVVKERDLERYHLKLPNTLDEGISFAYHEPYTGGGIAEFEFCSKAEQSAMLPIIRSFLKKVSACVACRSCEAECSFGAITAVDGKLTIDAKACTKCKKCYGIENNCWRYRSMSKPENSSGAANEFARYNNFGLREAWIPALIELGSKFFQWHSNHPLGNKMVDSAKKWFPQALLVSGDRKPTKLVELFEKQGTSSAIAWDLVWVALANNSPLIKWYCVSTAIDERNEVQDLYDLLKGSYPITNNAKDRRLDTLKNIAVESPIGAGNKIMLPETKGSKVIALTRKAKDVHPLTILYGLYIIAEKANRGSFTVRELMTADIESTFVSPLVAFGITPDTFKKQCEGLRTRYPNYISTTFTHGNDGLEVFYTKYTTEDIITLALGE